MEALLMRLGNLVGDIAVECRCWYAPL